MTATPEFGAIALPVGLENADFNEWNIVAANGDLLGFQGSASDAAQIVRALNLHGKLAKAARIASDVMARSNIPMTVDEIVSIREAADAIKYEAEGPTEQKGKME